MLASFIVQYSTTLVILVHPRGLDRIAVTAAGIARGVEHPSVCRHTEPALRLRDDVIDLELS